MKRVERNALVKTALDVVTTAKKSIFMTHSEEEATPRGVVSAYRKAFKRGVKITRVTFGNPVPRMRRIISKDSELGIMITKSRGKAYTRMLIKDGKEGIFARDGQVFYTRNKRLAAALIRRVIQNSD